MNVSLKCMLVHLLNLSPPNQNYVPTPMTVPLDILDSPDTESLNKWLSFYVIETRNCKGENYPLKTLYQLLCGLLRYARNKNPLFPNFLDLKNPSFNLLHNAMDNQFKKLRKDGVGSQKKSAEILTKQEEDLL